MVSTTRTIRYLQPGPTGPQGPQGPTLRGPQQWSDCPEGYHFEAGGPTDTWLDICEHQGNYYYCTLSHTKQASAPPTGGSNPHWRLGDRVGLVATRVLLTDYAVVRNLGAEGIHMLDAEGHTIFRAEGGNVECHRGTFDNVLLRSNTTGQRIEIDPTTRALKVYGAGGELTTQLSAHTAQSAILSATQQRTAVGLLPAAAQYHLLNPYTTSIAIPAGQTVEHAIPLSQVVATTASEAELQVPAYPEPNRNDHIIALQCQSTATNLTAQARLVVRSYSSADCANLTAEHTLASIAVPAPSTMHYLTSVGTGAAPLAPGYHRIEMVAAVSSPLSTTAQLAMRVTLLRAYLQLSGVSSQYMANGMAVVKNPDNLFLALYEQRTMHILARSTGRQVELYGGTLLIDGAKQPRTILHIRVGDNSHILPEGTPLPDSPGQYSTGLVKPFAYSSIRTIEAGEPHNVNVRKRATTGLYEVNIGHQFPISEWASHIRLQALGTPHTGTTPTASEGLTAHLTSISYTNGSSTNTTLHILLRDGTTPRWGAFSIEVINY